MPNELIKRFNCTKSVLLIKHKENDNCSIKEKKYGWFNAKVYSIINKISQKLFGTKTLTHMNLDASALHLYKNRFEITKENSMNVKEDIRGAMECFKEYLETPDGLQTKNYFQKTIQLLEEMHVDYFASYLHENHGEIILSHKDDAIAIRQDIESVKKHFKSYLRTDDGKIAKKMLKETLSITNGRIDFLP